MGYLSGPIHPIVVRARAMSESGHSLHLLAKMNMLNQVEPVGRFGQLGDNLQIFDMLTDRAAKLVAEDQASE